MAEATGHRLEESRQNLREIVGTDVGTNELAVCYVVVGTGAGDQT